MKQFLTECVIDKVKAQILRELFFANRINDLMDCLEAYINSSNDEQEIAKLRNCKNTTAKTEKLCRDTMTGVLRYPKQDSWV